MNLKKYSEIIKNNKTLFMILLFGMATRMLFSFWGSKFYFGEVSYTFGDSFSYTQSFLNLMKNGNYSFDLLTPDAYLYRGPVYPFFWGLHYLTFGENHVYQAVAFTQSLLDTLSGLFIYLSIYKITKLKKIALLGPLIYFFNATLLVHVPITGTETFATFLVTLIFYITISQDLKLKKILFIIGALCGFAVMTRQYLGILLPIVVLFVYVNGSLSIEKRALDVLIVIIGFSLCVTPLFLRNVINHNAPTILMGKTTGYTSYNTDYIAFNKFYTLFYVDVEPMFTSISLSGNDGVVSNEVLDAYKLDVNKIAKLSYSCGSSFNSWRDMKNNTMNVNKTDCNNEVVNSYNKLRAIVLNENGLKLWFEIPLENISKALFKNELKNPFDGYKATLVKAIFLFRTAILILGLIFVFKLTKHKEAVFMFFPILLVLYISFVFRQVEIRYLAQADALMTIFCVLSLWNIWIWVRKTKKF